MRIKELLNRRWKKVVAAIACVIGCFLLADLIFPVDADVEYAPLVEARDGSIMHMSLTRDEQWRFRTKLEEITPELSKAILFKEDKWFRYHFGVNPVSVCRAAFNNIFSRRRTSGASTITMQVARMLAPKKRTYANKLVEMFRALQLELHYSKDEILQLYLNLVPYGSNIQGVKAASMLYFNKSPDQLSLAEITALSIIPNRPNSLVIGKDNLYIEQQRNKWLKRFGEAGIFEPQVIADALKEPLLAYRREAPRMAPQFARRLRRLYPGLTTIRSTIDLRKQLQAEELTAGYMEGLKLQRIHNAAVLVLDNRSHEVVCYLGSSDFSDMEHHGQVDGVAAMRSPGSTLKPLLYGLCMDRGLITPRTMIADVPVNFKGYIPENYDLAFRGNVTAADALKNSLNIPAVKLLHEIGVGQFVKVMGSAGFSSLWRRRNQLGLSMILGGCGVRLEELTALYSAFGNEGRYYPPGFVVAEQSSDSKDTGTTVVSPAAAYMLGTVLKDLHRPDLPNLHQQAVNLPRIAWKTGTSYGRRDAWSIGYNSRYTIGVWIGNFSGKGVASLNGAGTATPLLFRLFHALDPQVSEEWLRQPKEVSFRLVCAKTGSPPELFCTEQVMDYYIPGRSTNIRCSHLKEVCVAVDERFAYCTSCVPARDYKKKTYSNLAPDLMAFYEAGNIPFDKMPPHNPSCSRVFDGMAPKINSLTDNMTYIIVDRASQQLQLGCQAANDVKKVYWYINDRFYSSAAAGEKIFFSPQDTELKISCTDDKGRNADIRVKVRFI